MTKIMLVEDDNNLREIYEARLLAEGYEIVSAQDGEEALALAVKERPDLIISDVMMPKISGFDMLDILRATPETKDTKVIMMTALSQAEDKARADKLGADRYLVKSQVTLEDVAKVAREVLNGSDDATASASVTSAETTGPAATTTTVPTVPQPAPNVVVPSPTVNLPVADTPATAPSSPANDTPASSTIATPPKQIAISDGPGSSTILPANPDEPASAPPVDPNLAASSSEQEASVDKQIESFIAQAPAKSPVSTPSAPLGQTTPSVETTAAATAPASNPANSVDATNLAAENADRLANMVNDIVNNKDSVSPPPQTANNASVAAPATPPSPAAANPSHRELTLQPINDVTNQAPNLDELLKKEEAAATPVAPPTVAGGVVAPGGEAVSITPNEPSPNPETPVASPPAGNVIEPGTDPNSIAL